MDKTYVQFTYLNGQFTFNGNAKVIDTISLSISGKSFIGVYELVSEKLRYFSTDESPQKLYWDRKYGIVKYVTFAGETWEKINFNDK